MISHLSVAYKLIHNLLLHLYTVIRYGEIYCNMFYGNKGKNRRNILQLEVECTLTESWVGSETVQSMAWTARVQTVERLPTQTEKTALLQSSQTFLCTLPLISVSLIPVPCWEILIRYYSTVDVDIIRYCIFQSFPEFLWIL